MKTTLAIIITTAALATAPFAAAQDASPRIRRVPTPPSRNQTAATLQNISAPAGEFLTNNVAITLAGIVADDIPLDVTLTGCAARVTSDFVLQGGEIPTIASINYLIRETSGNFTVTYEVALRIPIVTSITSITSINGDNKSISFQEASLQNTVRCTPGKPVEIYKSGKNSLALTVADAKQE